MRSLSSLFILVLSLSFVVDAYTECAVSGKKVVGKNQEKKQQTYKSAELWYIKTNNKQTCSDEKDLYQHTLAINTLLKKVNWIEKIFIDKLCDDKAEKCKQKAGYIEKCVPGALELDGKNIKEELIKIDDATGYQKRRYVWKSDAAGQLSLQAKICCCYPMIKVSANIQPCIPGQIDYIDRYHKVDVVVLNQIAGSFNNEQIEAHQYMVGTTAHVLKYVTPNGNGLPPSRVAYVEFDSPLETASNGVEVIVPLNHWYNDGTDMEQMVLEYPNRIANRYTFFEGDLAGILCDGTSNLLDAMKEAQNQFNLHPTAVDTGRDRYIVIFMNCPISESQKISICQEFEDWIKTGQMNADRGANQASKGITVMLIQQGVDFTGDADYIMCLVEYDENRIYSSLDRNTEDFENIAMPLIINEICEGPTPAPTSDPTTDPTSDPIANAPSQTVSSQKVMVTQNGIFGKLTINSNNIWILTLAILIVMVFMNIICFSSCNKNKTTYKKVYHSVNMKECDVEQFDEQIEKEENVPIYQ